MTRQTKRKKEQKKKTGKRILIVAALLLLLVGAGLISSAFVPENVILSGVIVNGVDLSGCTKDEAEALLTEQYKKDYKDTKIPVNALEKKYEVALTDTFAFDAEKAWEKAFSYGHSNILLDGVMMLKSKVLPTQTSFYPEIASETKLQKAYEDSGLAALNTTVQTSYEVVEEELVFTMGKTGYSVDLEKLTEELHKAVAKNDYETVIEAPMLQGTVEALDMEEVYKNVHKEKQNATLDPKNDYKIVRSVEGIDFDPEEAKQALEGAKEGDVISVAVVKEKPEITTKKLKKNLFKDELGTCTTYVSGSYARRSNVDRASSTIHKIILMPGEEFSYNDRVGERTAARGYQAAPAYLNGKTIDELGGGICQVSSTLYKATVLSNLEIVEHHNHTYESSYIGLGMDATVSWGGPDYKFKNNTEYPIKISAVYSGGALTCKIIGTNVNNYSVRFTSEVLKTIGNGTKYVDDPTLEEGKEKVLSSGHTGYIVQTYRTVLDANGNQVSSKKEDYNVYRKQDREVARGTKKVKDKDKKKTGDTSEADTQDTTEAGATESAEGTAE